MNVSDKRNDLLQQKHDDICAVAETQFYIENLAVDSENTKKVDASISATSEVVSACNEERGHNSKQQVVTGNLHCDAGACIETQFYSEFSKLFNGPVDAIPAETQLYP